MTDKIDELVNLLKPYIEDSQTKNTELKACLDNLKRDNNEIDKRLSAIETLCETGKEIREKCFKQQDIFEKRMKLVEIETAGLRGVPREVRIMGKDVVALQVKAGFWGLIGGAVSGLGIWLTTVLRLKT